VDDGKLVFGDSPLAGVIENNDRGDKLGATEDPKNVAELNPKKKNSVAFSPQANYTDRETAACRRSCIYIFPHNKKFPRPLISVF
jgi:hypothetical protein